MQTAIIDSKGQITIPGNIMVELGMCKGDEVFLVKEEGKLIIKPVHNSLKPLQDLMTGEAEKAGWNSTDDIMDFMKEVRKEFMSERRKSKCE